jgi:hypothetical protein
VTSINSYAAYAYNASASSTGATAKTAAGAAKAATGTDQSTGQAADSVTLSPQAQALLQVASDARDWLNAQYAELGTSSAMLDGKVAVDFTSQSRATLSAIADNAGGLFSQDESAAAGSELQARFDAAMAPHVVIARHTGDYAGLYQAAADYLDAAGTDEKATAAWQDQKSAVMAGLAAARKDFGKAPDTGNDKDPVKALLATPDATGSLDASASTGKVAANARAMLDDQQAQARDKGEELTFDPTRKTGQQVDFSDFDNRSLATIVLNQDSSFSAEEVRAAKSELGARTRQSMSDALFSTDSGSGSQADRLLGLLQTYQNMSPEERAALGVTDTTTDVLVKNYQTMLTFDGMVGGYSGGTTPTLLDYL